MNLVTRSRAVMLCSALAAFLNASIFVGESSSQNSTLGWYKGNTHSHTLRSDGDSEPEEVVKWYRDHGYNFLFITDHETITPVELLNRAFAKTGEFIVLQGQEVTDRLDGKPYHINGLGVSRVTMPHGGKTIVDNLQLNIDSVRASGGVPQINHPNFGWAINADHLRQLKNVKLIEIYNGHPLVNNLGGGGDPSVEMIWDDLLTSGKVIYGLASDDVHSVRKLGERHVPTPGHGWVMVRAAALSQTAILDAFERGDFYASTGVELTEYVVTGESVSIKIKADRWSKYRIQFIGAGGKILQENVENQAVYRLRKNEIYVRVRVLESNGKMAWTQPIFIKDLK